MTLNMPVAVVNVFACEKCHQSENSEHKFNSETWQRLKQHIVTKNSQVCMDSLFVCTYCSPILNSNNTPNHCVLHGLELDEVPVELSGLDALSKQLIQRAKAFQTVVRLGTYTGNRGVASKFSLVRPCDVIDR